jgi:hypothetical protein
VMGSSGAATAVLSDIKTMIGNVLGRDTFNIN